VEREEKNARGRELDGERLPPFFKYPGVNRTRSVREGRQRARKTRRILEKTTHFLEKTHQNLEKTHQKFFIYVRLTPETSVERSPNEPLTRPVTTL
jgi:hypothetical protein